MYDHSGISVLYIPYKPVYADSCIYLPEKTPNTRLQHPNKNVYQKVTYYFEK